MMGYNNLICVCFFNGVRERVVLVRWKNPCVRCTGTLTIMINDKQGGHLHLACVHARRSRGKASHELRYHPLTRSYLLAAMPSASYLLSGFLLENSLNRVSDHLLSPSSLSSLLSHLSAVPLVRSAPGAGGRGGARRGGRRRAWPPPVTTLRRHRRAPSTLASQQRTRSSLLRPPARRRATLAAGCLWCWGWPPRARGHRYYLAGRLRRHLGPPRPRNPWCRRTQPRPGPAVWNRLVCRIQEAPAAAMKSSLHRQGQHSPSVRPSLRSRHYVFLPPIGDVGVDVPRATRDAKFGQLSEPRDLPDCTAAGVHPAGSSLALPRGANSSRPPHQSSPAGGFSPSPAEAPVTGALSPANCTSPELSGPTSAPDSPAAIRRPRWPTPRRRDNIGSPDIGLDMGPGLQDLLPPVHQVEDVPHGARISSPVSRPYLVSSPYHTTPSSLVSKQSLLVSVYQWMTIPATLSLRRRCH